MLDSLRLREETACLARFLLEDFVHWFTSRKRPGEWALLVVDEFSALAGVAAMARCVEQARSFETALVLVPQVVAGLGEASEAERILGSVETVVCHRVNTPEEIVALAGTRQVTRYSARYTRKGSTGEGSMQRREEAKVDPKQRSGPASGRGVRDQPRQGDARADLARASAERSAARVARRRRACPNAKGEAKAEAVSRTGQTHRRRLAVVKRKQPKGR